MGLEGGSIDFRDVVGGVPVREDGPDDVVEVSCFVGDLLGDWRISVHSLYETGLRCSYR